MDASITETVVRRQLLAMRSDRFEIGVLKTNGRMTLCENQSIDRICKSMRWLRRENARGAHVFIRPAWPHTLSFVDDLNANSIEQMRDLGFEPAVLVETSPDNFQVWLNHGRVLCDRLLSTLVARQLAIRFGGDRGSCDWRHFGRLAGFTNQKKERRLQNGFQPFVRLRSSEGNVYSAAKEFLREGGTDARTAFTTRAARVSAPSGD